MQHGRIFEQSLTKSHALSRPWRGELVGISSAPSVLASSACWRAAAAATCLPSASRGGAKPRCNASTRAPSGKARASSASGRSRVPACAGPIFHSRCPCWARVRRSATATICVRPATSRAARDPRPRAGRSGLPNAPPVQQQPPYQSRVLPEYQSRPVQPPPRGARARSAGVARAAERDRSGERRAGDLRFSATLRGGAGAAIPVAAGELSARRLLARTLRASTAGRCAGNIAQRAWWHHANAAA